MLVGVQVLPEEWINLIYAINISGAVNINTIGTTTTTIGNILSTTNISGNTINISGALNINTGGTATTTIGNINTTTNISGSAINMSGSTINISGILNICTTGGNTTIGSTTGSGYTDIQSNVISIGGSLSGTGTINIGGQANTTTGYVLIGGVNLNENSIKGKNINLNTDTGGNGNVNLLHVNSTGTINLYRPLSPQYSYPIASGKIGEIINGTYAPAAGAFFTYSNPIVYSSITLSQVGVYIFQGNLLVNTNNSSITNITWISVDISISGGAVLSNEQKLNQVPPGYGYGFVMCANAIVYNTGVTTYNISINTNFTGGNPYPNGGFFIYKAVRIA